MTYGTALFILVYVIVATLALGGISAAPWVPTRKRDRKRIADLVPMRPDAKVFDLGCGDGGVLFALAERHPRIKAVGYEIAFLPLAIGWIRKMFGGASARAVSLRCRDFFGRDLSDADVVFVFLFKDSYPRVMAKLVRELRDDALVVVEAWPFPNAVPQTKIEGDKELLPMFFYSGASLRATAA